MFRAPSRFWLVKAERGTKYLNKIAVKIYEDVIMVP